MHSYFVEFNGKIILIECSMPTVANSIARLFKDLLVTHTNNLPLLKTYSVTQHGLHSEIIIKHQEEIIHSQKNGHTVEVANVLMNQIKLDILSTIQDSLVLHAALVSYNGKSILLPGNSGHGKSLTTLGLLSLGCEYHTDEVVLHHSIDNTITPFVRPLMIKPHGIEAARALIGQDIDDFLIQGETIHSLPVDSLHSYFHTDLLENNAENNHSLHKPPPIHAIVFPQYSEEADAEIVSLSPAQTMIELFKNNVVARNLPDLGTSSLKQLAQQARGVKLHYANYTQLPDLFKKIRTMMQ